MSCSNHICNATLSETGEHVACSLCKAAVYCSTKCQAMDWLKHDCPNVIHVDHIDAQVMVPYYYEDRLPMATVEKLDVQDPVFASYSIVHHGTNQVVSHRIQEPLLYNLIGAEEQEPQQQQQDVKFTITVKGEDGQEHVISGSSLKDVVLAANKHNNTAAKLAAKEPVEGMLYWKPIAKEIRVPLAGELDFTFQMEGKQPISIGGLYNLSSTIPQEELSKEVKKAMDQQLRLKFKTADPNAFRVLQVGDAAGNRVAVAFKMDPKTPDTATLADVEFLTAPASDHKENIASQMESIEYECNPRKVEDLVGLTMTLERHIQMNAPFIGEQDKARLETVAGVIHKHTRAILDGKRSVDEEIPAEVDTAIYTAMGELYDLEAIGPSLWQRGKRWLKRKLKLPRYEKKLKGLTTNQLVEEWNQKLNAIYNKQESGSDGSVEVNEAYAIMTEAENRDPTVSLGNISTFKAYETRMKDMQDIQRKRLRQEGKERRASLPPSQSSAAKVSAPPSLYKYGETSSAKEREKEKDFLVKTLSEVENE